MVSGNRKVQRSVYRVARWAVLLGVLVTSTTLGILHQKMPELRLLGIDGLCPFGGLESFWAVFTTGAMLKRIEVGSFVLLIAAIVGALVFRRAFCGMFCPLGTLQELVGVLRDKLGFSRREMPAWLDRPARFLKYAVLAVVALMTWRAGELVIRPYDPWAAYNHLTSSELLTEFGVGIAVLGVSLVGSLVYDRFFCKYACPMGAFLAPISRLGHFRIERNAEACIDCGACDRACTMNCAVSTSDGAVNDIECIACGECVAVCPKPEALAVKGRGTLALKPLVLVGATTALFLSVVAIATATGEMRFTKPSLAEQVRESDGGIAGDHEPGESVGAAAVGAPSSAAAGGFDTSLIKGYMTIAEVAEATGIPIEELAGRYNVPPEATTEPMKEIKDAYGFSVEDVRAYVAEQTAGR